MLVFEETRRKKQFPEKSLSQQEKKVELKKLDPYMASLPAVETGEGDIRDLKQTGRVCGRRREKTS